MGGSVLDLQEIDRTQVSLVGGKGAAHLGELSRAEGIHVPAGFCVTTEAFERMMAAAFGWPCRARLATVRISSSTL